MKNQVFDLQYRLIIWLTTWLNIWFQTCFSIEKRAIEGIASSKRDYSGTIVDSIMGLLYTILVKPRSKTSHKKQLTAGLLVERRDHAHWKKNGTVCEEGMEDIVNTLFQENEKWLEEYLGSSLQSDSTFCRDETPGSGKLYEKWEVSTVSGRYVKQLS